MILKEIKPGMAVHCENDDELKELLEEAKKSGYQWRGEGTICPAKDLIKANGRTIHFYGADKITAYRNIAHSDITNGTTKFSDLILPEPSAEEVLQICNEICHGRVCSKCPIQENCFWKLDSDKSKVVEFCARWKAAHGKKTPEYETVDICRIMKVMPDGSEQCVHKEDIRPDPELPYVSDEYVARKILKRYCMEHEGEFIAVHEVVSRVKR